MFYIFIHYFSDTLLCHQGITINITIKISILFNTTKNKRQQKNNYNNKKKNNNTDEEEEEVDAAAYHYSVHHNAVIKAYPMWRS